MDKFVNIKKIKKISQDSFIGNEDVVRELKECIIKGKTVCLYGESGSGKTHLVNELLPNFVEITYDILRSKVSTIDFFDKIKNTNTDIVIDEFDYELVGTKEIVENINNNVKLTNGCFIIISKSIKKLEKCEVLLEIKSLTINQLVNFGKQKYSSIPLNKVVSYAKQSRGNIRNFLNSLHFSDKKDIFKTPKEFIYDLVCSDVKYPETPSVQLCKQIQEHGFSWGIVHENYLDSANIDDCYENIADWMSTADTLDNLIYEGNWDLYEFFSIYGIIMPSMKINHSLKTETMRPGSSWTKYSNYKMRLMKFRNLSKKHTVDLDRVYLLQQYLSNGDLSQVKSYKLQSHDLDTINHLCIKNKLKPKVLLKLKKTLKNETE